MQGDEFRVLAELSDDDLRAFIVRMEASVIEHTAIVVKRKREADMDHKWQVYNALTVDNTRDFLSELDSMSHEAIAMLIGYASLGAIVGSVAYGREDIARREAAAVKASD